MHTGFELGIQYGVRCFSVWLLGVQGTRMPEDFVKILRTAGNILQFNKVSVNVKLSRLLNDINYTHIKT